MGRKHWGERRNCSLRFLKACFLGASKGVIVWEWAILSSYFTVSDLQNAIHCSDHSDCPQDSSCSGDAVDKQMKNLCMCVHTLIPAKRGEDCAGRPLLY